MKKLLETHNDNCEIVCADYREFIDTISSNSVDLVLTDPPYAISRKTGFRSLGKRSVARFAVSMDFGDWDHQEIDLNALTNKCFRILRKGGTIIVFYDLWKVERLYSEMEAAGFKMLRLIIWQKTNPVPLNSKRTYLSNSREVAVVGVKVGKPTFNAEYHNGVYHYPIPRHNGKRIHPTQKPDDLFVDLVKVHSNVGDLVVDPFLGGGQLRWLQYHNSVALQVVILILAMLSKCWSACNERPARMATSAGFHGCFVFAIGATR